MENTQILKIINSISNAGEKMLEIYNTGDFGVEMKSDNSPLTKADKTANEILVETLSQFDYPILSEEGKEISYEIRKDWTRFWLVDPLDGTKEFIKKNGEFTINIALIENGEPIIGFVYAPVLENFYLGIKNKGASKFKLKPGDKLSILPDINSSIRVKEPDDKLIVVASRSHFNKDTEDFISKLKSKYKEIQFISKGSSLKLCMVAEGTAHCYPRFGPTMEWDTAAAHAVVIAAGGKVLDLEGYPLLYSKKDLLNPYFIVSANKDEFQSF